MEGGSVMSNFVIVTGPVNEILKDHSVKLMVDRIEKAINHVFKHKYEIERKHDTLFITPKKEIKDEN